MFLHLYSDKLILLSFIVLCGRVTGGYTKEPGLDRLSAFRTGSVSGQFVEPLFWNGVVFFMNLG